MLYDRWREIANQFAKERALTDVSTGESWTFEQLATAAEKGKSEAPVVFPQGNNPEFVLSVLRGWRQRAAVCPMEAGQTKPELQRLPPQIAHVKLTSGTTGAPRAILFRAEQIAADAANIVETMRLTPEVPNLAFISLAHSYGFSNLITPLLLHGVPLILGGAPLPEVLRVASSVSAKITLPAVPALWRAWFGAGAIPGNIHIAISAAAPLPIQLECDIFERSGLKIHNFYGASECGGIAFDRSTLPREDATVIGGPLANVSLSKNADGHLAIKSAAVGETYWPEEDARLRAGTFQTTDVVELRDGQVRLQGRAGDQLNLAGRKVQPETIEEVIRQHPDVAQCIVFGCADGERTEIAIAAVVVRRALSVQELNSFSSERLPAWQIPRRWWFVASLSENARGKISRREIRKRFHALTSSHP